MKKIIIALLVIFATLTVEGLGKLTFSSSKKLLVANIFVEYTIKAKAKMI